MFSEYFNHLFLSNLRQTNFLLQIPQVPNDTSPPEKSNNEENILVKKTEKDPFNEESISFVLLTDNLNIDL